MFRQATPRRTSITMHRTLLCLPKMDEVSLQLLISAPVDWDTLRTEFPPGPGIHQKRKEWSHLIGACLALCKQYNRRSTSPMMNPAASSVIRNLAPPLDVSWASRIPWSSSSQPSPRLRGPAGFQQFEQSQNFKSDRVTETFGTAVKVS